MVSATLLAPEDDDFYTAPANISSYKLGEVIKIRSLPAPLSTVLFPVNVKNSWQIGYRSSDSFGNANIAIETIIEPWNADANKVVSYQIFEDSSQINCCPSYSILQGSNLDTLESKAEMYIIQAALDQGWYVIIPDYEGLKSAFTAARQSGHAVLDGIRAALNTKESGINSNAEIQIWGYSGGSFAAGAAVGLHSTYAPDLTNIIGAAIGGFVTNITSVALTLEGTSGSGITALAVRGLCNEYPEFAEVIFNDLVEDKKASFNKTQEICLTNVETYFGNVSFYSGDDKYFKSGLDLFYNDVVADVLEQNTLGLNETELPIVPIFIYQAEKDDTAPVDLNALQIYDTWESWGIKSLELTIDNTTNHIEQCFVGAPAALAWLKKRFNGVEPVQGAQKTERESNLLYPGVDASIADFILAGAKNVANLKIGPSIFHVPENILNVSNSFYFKTTK